MNTARPAQQVNTALNNMNAQIKPLTEANAQINAGAKQLNDGQMGLANRNAVGATNKLKNVSENLRQQAARLNNASRNTNNKKLAGAANQALRASEAAKKASITNALAHIAQSAKLAAESTVSAGVNINRKN